jgi:hypothetical protein
MGKCARCDGTGRVKNFLGYGYTDVECDCRKASGPADEARVAPGAAATGRDSYLVHVGPNRTLAQAIAAGGYVYSDPRIIAANMPSLPEQAGDVRVEILNFDSLMTTREVKVRILSRGFLLADIWVTLAYGEKYPEFQRKFPLFCLGSSMSGDTHNAYLYPYLSTDHVGRRTLYLRWVKPSSAWYSDHRFLAVRK